MKKLISIIFFVVVFNEVNCQSITKWSSQDYINYTKNKYDTAYIIYFWSVNNNLCKEQIFLFDRILKSFPMYKLKSVLVNIDKDKRSISSAQKFLLNSKIVHKSVSMNIDSVNSIVYNKSIPDLIKANNTLLIFREPFAPIVYKELFTEFALVHALEQLQGYKNYKSNRGPWRFDSTLNRYFISPMKEASSIYPVLKYGHINDESNYLFSSKCEDVFSVGGGMVRSVKKYNNNTTQIEVVKGKLVYTYTNLKEYFVKPCDSILSGQKIAKAIKGFKYHDIEHEMDKYSMNLYIYANKQQTNIPLSSFLIRY